MLWDHVYRIVPRNVQPRDNREVLEAVDAGLIRNITLDDTDLSQTADHFAMFMDQMGHVPDGITPNVTPLHPGPPHQTHVVEGCASSGLALLDQVV